VLRHALFFRSGPNTSLVSTDRRPGRNEKTRFFRPHLIMLKNSRKQTDSSGFLKTHPFA
jgi:hypothetical protein